MKGLLMLVDFKFENFLSYKDETKFSMRAGNTRKHRDHIINTGSPGILKFAALYGGNASGKSNFIKALKFSKQVILEGIDEIDTSDKCCRTNEDCSDLKTKFTYVINIDNTLYEYSFSILMKKALIQSEYLKILDSNVYVFKKSFSNNHNKIELDTDYLKFNKADKNRIEVYKSDFKQSKSKLFLTELNNGKEIFYVGGNKSIINEVFVWFKDKLEISLANEVFSSSYSIFRGGRIEELTNFLSEAGTGVSDITRQEVEQHEVEKELIKKQILESIKKKMLETENVSFSLVKTPNNLIFITKIPSSNDFIYEKLLFIHENSSAKYTLGEESDGTVRLVEIYDLLASVSNKVFILDEIDRSLHPNLTYGLIKKFLSQSKNNQLIVTTHEDRLLDLNLLRRDEIWFVDKNSQGYSTLTTLEDFKERFDRDILSAYLDGRYGAIPKISLIH